MSTKLTITDDNTHARLTSRHSDDERHFTMRTTTWPYDTVYVQTRGGDFLGLETEPFMEAVEKLGLTSTPQTPAPALSANDLANLRADVVRYLHDSFITGYDQRADRLIEIILGEAGVEMPEPTPDWHDALVIRATCGGETVMLSKDYDGDWMPVGPGGCGNYIAAADQDRELSDVEILVRADG